MSKKRNREPAPRSPRSAAMNKITHKGYTIVQSARSHRVAIGKDGKVLHYGSSDHTLTEQELRRRVDDFINIAEHMA